MDVWSRRWLWLSRKGSGEVSREASVVWDKIVAYRVDSVTKSVQLSRSLHGYKDRSNKGRYVYARKGLLDKVPCLQLQKGVLLIREKDTQPLVRLLQKYGAEYYIAKIETSHTPRPRPTQPQDPQKQPTK
jgi:hypothetical protein